MKFLNPESEYRADTHQQQKFYNQLHAFQGMIGIPHWQSRSGHFPPVDESFVVPRERAARGSKRRLGSLIAERVGAYFSELYTRYRIAVQYRRNVRELTQLNDHMLRDIGVSRSEIRSVAAENALTYVSNQVGEGASAQIRAVVKTAERASRVSPVAEIRLPLESANDTCRDRAA